MRTKLILGAGIASVVILGGGAVWYAQSHHKELATPATGSQPGEASTTRAIPLAFFQNETDFDGVSPLVYTDSKTGVTVSFRGVVEEARNSGSNLYIGDTPVGPVQGFGIVDPTFSPDGRYFGFIETSICGGTCQSYDIYVVDLSAGTLSLMDSPLPSMTDNDPFLESFTWNSKNAFTVVAYLTKFDETSPSEFTRISPKQLWQYDLSTGKYTFVKDLPEQ